MCLSEPTQEVNRLNWEPKTEGGGALGFPAKQLKTFRVSLPKP